MTTARTFPNIRSLSIFYVTIALYASSSATSGIASLIAMSSSRSVVLGTNAAVATSQPLASEIGINILRQGGNAIDAAVAISAALAVTEPCSTGLGGDCFILYYENKLKKVFALNGSGRCPKGLTLEKALKDTGSGDAKKLPLYHPHTVTVPGAAAAWDDALSQWGSGRFTLGKVLEPAALLAERGYPVGPVTAKQWQKYLYQLDNGPNGRELMAQDDICRAPNCGEIFQNPNLAQTLREFGIGGKREFYGGRIGQEIVNVVSDAGGVLSLDDLISHTSTFPDPISIDYRGIRIYEAPPNGQGITALLALNILRHLEAGDDSDVKHDLSAEASILHMHRQIEALRLAFSYTRYYCADPEFESVPIEGLLSFEHAKEIAKLFNPSRAIENLKYGYPISTSCTVSFQVVDDGGNAVSFVNSNYMSFGTGLVPRGCGFSLQNRGYGFSLDSNHPNCLAPGKRPYHTIIPCIATYDDSGELYATLTNMGAFMQPQGHVQLMCRLLQDSMDPQRAIDQPRFCILDGTANGVVLLEHEMPLQIVEGLRKLGHNIAVAEKNQFESFGRAQIILRDKSCVLWAGSDGRADGIAIAY